ncbi:unnamed protein product [Sphagnum balticum]
MENARKTKMVLEVVSRRCKAKPLWNPKTRTMTQVHSQQTMSTRMRYTWRGCRHGCWFQCLYNEWRGLFGWSYEWRAILGWGSRKEQVTVFIFSELLNLQDSVDCESIPRLYYFAVI